MSASGPPLCRVCLKEHWSREPHILPANAKGETRSKRPVITLPTPANRSEQNTSADRGKAPKGGGRTPGRSGDSSSSRFPAQAGETPVKNASTAATPGKSAGKKGQRRAAKPSPGTRKPRTKVKIVDKALRTVGDINISASDAERLRLPPEKANKLLFGRWPEAKTKVRKRGKKKCAP